MFNCQELEWYKMETEYSTMILIPKLMKLIVNEISFLLVRI